MATKVNLIMDQAATFSSSFTVLDILGNSIDFSTYTASSQMRKTYMSVNSYSFSVVANSTGGITLSMPANTTANIESPDRPVGFGVTSKGINVGFFAGTSSGCPHPYIFDANISIIR